ncbi:hypothetical protein [Falsiroseomonas oryzae]|uniref:hypothetical protein n=1 Tax=Falsiroseomonas oryzae TaxID=2766473 RepID=UPI0022EA5A4A|nr:hypothetical protein [Roseomonas sp. MO-31]
MSNGTTAEAPQPESPPAQAAAPAAAPPLPSQRSHHFGSRTVYTLKGALTGFMVGAIIGGLVAIVVATNYAGYAGIRDLGGPYAKRVAFYFLPACGAVGGLLGASWNGRRAYRRWGRRRRSRRLP